MTKERGVLAVRRRDREPSFAYPPLISQSFSRRLLRIALIVLALFDAIDEMLDLVSISGVEVIVVFHRRRSRRSYARQKRTPRPERKYFLFSRGLTAGTPILHSKNGFAVLITRAEN